MACGLCVGVLQLINIMIISHKHKFVFLRTIKTGSSSAQAMIVDSGILGTDDIYSNVNGMCSSLIRGSFNHFPHATPDQLVKLGFIDDYVLSNYQFITTVRNPFDRFLSSFFYRYALSNRPAEKFMLIQTIVNSTPSQLSSFLGPSQREYFYCNAIRLSNLFVVKSNEITFKLGEKIYGFGGSLTKKIFLNSQVYPSWFSDNKSDFIPEKYRLILVEKLSYETDIFNEIISS